MGIVGGVSKTELACSETPLLAVPAVALANHASEARALIAVPNVPDIQAAQPVQLTSNAGGMFKTNGAMSETPSVLAVPAKAAAAPAQPVSTRRTHGNTESMLSAL